MTRKISLSSGLLLQSFGEVTVAFLQFLEQPDVFDRDHRLVGEGFEQFDLRRGEGAHLHATRGQYANQFLMLAKGNGQVGAAVDDGTHVGKSFCAWTSGRWSAPCSRIQRYCGSSVLISRRRIGMGPK